MKVTKIKIKNLFGISEIELDGKSAELKGNELLSDVDKSTLLELLSKIGIELL